MIFMPDSLLHGLLVMKLMIDPMPTKRWNILFSTITDIILLYVIVSNNGAEKMKCQFLSNKCREMSFEKYDFYYSHDFYYSQFDRMVMTLVPH